MVSFDETSFVLNKIENKIFILWNSLESFIVIDSI